MKKVCKLRVWRYFKNQRNFTLLRSVDYDNMMNGKAFGKVHEVKLIQKQDFRHYSSLTTYVIN